MDLTELMWGDPEINQAMACHTKTERGRNSGHHPRWTPGCATKLALFLRARLRWTCEASALLGEKTKEEGPRLRMPNVNVAARGINLPHRAVRGLTNSTTASRSLDRTGCSCIGFATNAGVGLCFMSPSPVAPVSTGSANPGTPPGG
jgi:hypothetical protein